MPPLCYIPPVILVVDLVFLILHRAINMGKLILRPSYLKIHAEPLKFLERIQGDICCPIQPLSGPFRYFMVLIDAS